ncbi:MAG: GntR family transcriptional regulator [Alphaproteobacteria bacterium]|nr:GntR family transcriptional regulator [Alphaproteobacteria bacterium]
MASRVAAETGRLETVERNTLQEQIYQQLRNSIMSGFFKPGQPLSTRAVAEAVGVSVMPVRDALRRLEVEKALVVGHNRTLEVPRLTSDTLHEICQMRVALEGLAVERAASAIRPTDIRMLESLCATMDEGIRNEDSDAYLQANWAFHSQIYQSAPGEILMSAIESLWLRMGPYFRMVAGDRGHVHTAMAIHREIVLAFVQNDAGAARAAVVADIETATADLASWLELQQTGPRAVDGS